MLSGILNSDRAIQVNIAIMRAFVQLRRFLESNKDLTRKFEELEKAVSTHDEKIGLIFAAIKVEVEMGICRNVYRNFVLLSYDR